MPLENHAGELGIPALNEVSVPVMSAVTRAESANTMTFDGKAKAGTEVAPAVMV